MDMPGWWQHGWRRGSRREWGHKKKFDRDSPAFWGLERARGIYDVRRGYVGVYKCTGNVAGWCARTPGATGTLSGRCKFGHLGRRGPGVTWRPDLWSLARWRTTKQVVVSLHIVHLVGVAMAGLR